MALGLGLGLSFRRSVPSAGGEPEEFITNGAFAADTNWTKGSGWTIAAGLASQSGALGFLAQDFGALVQALISGNDYLLTFDLVNGSGGAVQVTLGGGTGSQIVYADAGVTGPISVPFTATSDRTTISFRSNDEVPIDIDNVSLVPA